MIDETEIFDGVVGGGELTEENMHEGIDELKGLVVTSELDKDVARLLVLHPDLRLKFRNNNIASLDEDTKRSLLQDMQIILGIAPLRND